MTANQLDDSDILNYLFGLQKFGMKLGIENIKSLLHSLRNPHQKFPTIHIAGTNGKGSTASFIAAILTASGYKTGLYTSPHLVRFNERIRINSNMIADERIEEYTDLLKPQINLLNATFFEATTAMAFKYFADEKVDIAVIETGLGGRLDSTNVITPLLSIITNISLEHTEYLGNTLESIAFEKAGIIKRNVPVFTAVEQQEVLNVIKQQAIEMDSKCNIIDLDKIENPDIQNFNRMKFSFIQDGITNVITSELVGEHQTANCALAIESALHLQKNGWNGITQQSIKVGIENVRLFSGLRSRLECIQQNPEIVIDVAHNPDGFKSMLKTFSSLRRTDKTHLIFGVLSTKNYKSIIKEIAKFTWKTINICSLTSNEGQSCAIIQEEFMRSGISSFRFDSVMKATGDVLNSMIGNETILMCGSHYLMGEYLQHQEKNIYSSP